MDHVLTSSTSGFSNALYSESDNFFFKLRPQLLKLMLYPSAYSRYGNGILMQIPQLWQWDINADATGRLLSYQVI
jgi:hypothetical protein